MLVCAFNLRLKRKRGFHTEGTELRAQRSLRRVGETQEHSQEWLCHNNGRPRKAGPTDSEQPRRETQEHRLKPMLPACRSSAGFEEFAEGGGGVFAEFAVVGTEGGEEVGVDVEFADNFAADEDGDNDFGLGFEGAGEVAGVGVDVVDDDGFAAGGRGAADALVEGNAGVASWCL